MRKSKSSLETIHLEDKQEWDIRLNGKEDICWKIWNRERKHLIIVKQYPEIDSEFDFVQIKKIIKETSKEEYGHQIS